jgi:hypothetical protein
MAVDFSRDRQAQEFAEMFADHAPDTGSSWRFYWSEGFWFALQAAGYSECDADRIIEEGQRLERERSL